MWSRGISINLHSRKAKRLRQAPVLKPAAGKEPGRCLEDGCKTISPGQAVTATELCDSKSIIYTTSKAQGMPGKRGWEEGESGGGVGRCAAKRRLLVMIWLLCS